MRVLITGGFGNVGVCVIHECLRRGFDVTVFDVPSRRTKQLGLIFRRRLRRVVFGDIRDPQTVASAILEQDAVVHMAAILPPVSEADRDRCFSVNAVGTQNLVTAMTLTNPAASLVLVSSVVADVTGDRSQLMTTATEDAETSTYGRSKRLAEGAVRASTLQWCILRLSAVMPTRGSFSMDRARMVFDLPQSAHYETVVDLDVAAAIANAAERLNKGEPVAGKTYVIGGGSECQVTGAQVADGLFQTIGLPSPSPELFSKSGEGLTLGWLDTQDSERDLQFQSHSFADYRDFLRKKFRLIRPLVRLFRRPISARIARLSPHHS